MLHYPRLQNHRAGGGANEAALRPPKGSNGLEKCINPRFVCLVQAYGRSWVSRPFFARGLASKSLEENVKAMEFGALSQEQMEAIESILNRHA
jgi:hypothetical protein